MKILCSPDMKSIVACIVADIMAQCSEHQPAYLLAVQEATQQPDAHEEHVRCAEGMLKRMEDCLRER